MQRTTQLSSDRLENQFGATIIEVLRQGKSQRLITTKVKKTGQRLELSFVRFLPTTAADYSEIHEQILAGGSIGKTFRLYGVPIERYEKSAAQVLLPETLADWFDIGGYATVVEVSIMVGPKPKRSYAQIFEVYSPLVKWPLSPEGQAAPGTAARLAKLGHLVQ
ncbi:MAG TPA: hypothetical protein VG604_01790 [Candidatus Saccharimonadales bacterium]|nr:hypothetical protein [Candidatus Saccharimonadales bacterium]